jgi:hypothetical protein
MAHRQNKKSPAAETNDKAQQFYKSDDKIASASLCPDYLKHALLSICLSIIHILYRGVLKFKCKSPVPKC